MTLSRALELYWQFAEEDTLDKSADQVRRWRNPRIKAFRNLISVVGDRPLTDLTREDMLAFRDWWIERVKSGQVQKQSANKDFTYVSAVLRRVNDMMRLGLDLPLDRLAFRSAEKNRRPAFSTSWITDRILAPGALDGLNLEARCILLGMVNTGYRLGEAEALTRDQIRLDHDVPHISIEPVERQLKTRHSVRIVPLAGVSLEAFRSCPDGFPRYRQGAGVSNLLTKYLRNNKLLETPEHSTYSLRHSFEDRLLAAGVDNRIRSDLMGHAFSRQKYGAGASIEQMFEAIKLISL
ncbi:site-specific integrase [Palleronia caenipelagi]|uniref:tyrosine-type recombinase/integrase n=1 Tax=Palleronia caenipelagi TaxID=2489174 RepID=UPI00319DA1F5